MDSTRLRERCGTGLRLALYAAACLTLGAAKRFMPLPTLARLMWRDSAGPRDRGREARDIAVALTATRWARMRGSDCLQRSLLLYGLLSRSGADPRLIIGFRRQSTGVEGHAWVKVDGRAVADTEEGLVDYTPLVAFGLDGERCSPE